jgi:glycosyltransferase involved in cell wall biosynthesis
MTLIDTLRVQGGAERLAIELAVRLDRERFAPAVCVTRWAPEWHHPLDDPGLEALRAAGVPVIGLKRYGKLDVRPWRRFVGMLRSGRVGVLHAHKFGSNVWAALLGPLAGVPAVVAHEHTWSYEGQVARRLLDRHVVARGADVVIAVSREDRRRMIEIEGIPAERIRYIPNGVAPFPGGDGARVRRELGIGEDVPLVGAVGSLRAQKAFEVLIEAAALLRDRRPDVRVVIAGGGDEEPRLRAHIAALGVGGTVTLLGHRTDVPDVLAALDVAVNCSDFEGQPLALLEAMDAALPIVATRVGGVPDLIEDGVHGLLVPRRDPAALATAIERHLADRKAAEAMGRRARERRRSAFDIDTTVRRVEALYEELLARGATASRAGPVANSIQSTFE